MGRGPEYDEQFGQNSVDFNNRIDRLVELDIPAKTRRMMSLIDYVENVITPNNHELVQKALASGGDQDRRDAALFYGVGFLGARLEIFKETRRLINIHQKDKAVVRELEDYLPYYYFRHLPEAGVTISNIRAVDILQPKIEEKRAADLLSFLVDCRTIGQGFTSPGSQFEQNPAFTRDYPAVLEDRIETVARRVLYTTSILPADKVYNPENDQPDLGNDNIGEAVLQESYRFYRRCDEIRDKVHRVLSNPADPQFRSVRERAMALMSSSDDVALSFISEIIPRDMQKMKSLYRKAEVLAEDPKNQEFYLMLGLWIEQFADPHLLKAGMYTREDVAVFTIDPAAQLMQVPTIDDIRQTAVGLRLDGKEIEIPVDYKQFKSANLLTPAEARLVISGGSQLKFDVFFHYQNESGDSDNLQLTFDLRTIDRIRRNIFDFSFLPSPGNLPIMRDSSYILVHQLLQKLVASNNNAESAQQKDEVELPTRSKKRKVPRRSFSQKTPGTPWQTVRTPDYRIPISSYFESEKDSEKGVIEYVIELPEGEEFDELFEESTENDKSKMLADIEKFNIKGLGKFQELELSDSEGNKRFTLDTRTSIPKGHRIFLQDTKSGQVGKRVFKAIKIKKRSDAYK